LRHWKETYIAKCNNGAILHKKYDHKHLKHFIEHVMGMV